MKRPLLLSLAAIIVISVMGCANLARQPAPTTRGQLAVALAVTVNGTEQPTPSQWAAIVAAVRPQLEAAGYIFATNLATADRILRIDFTPDPLAPETRGHAVALGWRSNPSMAIASTSYRSGPSSFSYVNYGMGYNHSFYDYYNDYTGTWTRSAGDAPAPALPTPPDATKPGHQGRRPGHAGRGDPAYTGRRDPDGKHDRTRPPGDDARPPGRYAGRGDSTGNSASSGSTNSGSSNRSSWWRGRSDGGSSDSSRSSRSESHSSSSSSSSSSYSSPSYSSSDSGGSSSSSGGSSSSGSSSSFSGGGFDSSPAGSTQIER